MPRLTRRFNREFKDLAELDPGAFGNPQAAAQAVHAGGDPRDRLQDDARRRGASHDPARRQPARRLPLRRRLLRPPAAEGAAPGRRLRRALSARSRLSCAIIFSTHPGRPGRPGHAAQSVRAGGRQDPLRSFPGRDQRADDPGERHFPHRRPYPAARHAPVPHRAARLPAARRDRYSTGSSARRTRTGSNSPSPRFWRLRPTFRHSPRTTWPSASSSTT